MSDWRGRPSEYRAGEGRVRNGSQVCLRSQKLHMYMIMSYMFIVEILENTDLQRERGKIMIPLVLKW